MDSGHARRKRGTFSSLDLYGFVIAWMRNCQTIEFLEKLHGFMIGPYILAVKVVRELV